MSLDRCTAPTGEKDERRGDGQPRSNRFPAVAVRAAHKLLASNAYCAATFCRTSGSLSLVTTPT